MTIATAPQPAGPKEKRRISIKLRVLGSMGLAMTIFFISLILIVEAVETVNLRTGFNKDTTTYAQLATASIGDHIVGAKDLQAAEPQIDHIVGLDSDVVGFALLSDSGKVLVQKGAVNSSVPPTTQVSSRSPSMELGSTGVFNRIIYPFFDSSGRHRYTMVYTISDSSITTSVRHTATTLIPIVICTLFICGVLFFALANRFVLSPIRKIRDAARTISGGQLDVQIVADHNDEIGDLAVSVGQMTDSLKLSIQKLQDVDNLKSEFIMISSHNLRTPLTEIKGYLELLQAALLDPQTKKVLDTISISANRLMNFSEDMLTVASVEANRGATVQLEPVPIGDVVAPLITEFTMIAKQQELRFVTKLETPRVRVSASPTLLRSALRNLLENACKFTQAGGTVSLSVYSHGNEAIVEVQDSGIGISDTELPKLFTKFHRGTSMLTYNYEGVGMGLYATKLILDQHHATIKVKSALGKGSQFTVIIPTIQ